MKFREWSEIAELVGIAAVVASLVFVGLQLKQSQSIAASERFLLATLNRVEVNNAINEHAEIWIRGNAGADLTASDAVIYKNLIANLFRQYYFSAQSAAQLGNDRGALANRREWTVFLHKNPGARRLWEALLMEEEQTMNILHPGQFAPSDWHEFVQSDLVKLSDAQS